MVICYALEIDSFEFEYLNEANELSEVEKLLLFGTLSYTNPKLEASCEGEKDMFNQEFFRLMLDLEEIFSSGSKPRDYLAAFNPEGLKYLLVYTDHYDGYDCINLFKVEAQKALGITDILYSNLHRKYKKYYPEAKITKANVDVLNNNDDSKEGKYFLVKINKSVAFVVPQHCEEELPCLSNLDAKQLTDNTAIFVKNGDYEFVSFTLNSKEKEDDWEKKPVKVGFYKFNWFEFN